MSTLRGSNGRKSPSKSSDAAPSAKCTPSGTNSLPELLTADDVASWLGITRKAVYQKVERGILPGAWHVGRRLYFLRAELLRLVEQGRVPYLGDPGGGT
ncbi:MAG TPA: helix-turn-helix domain-containing protein [Polyangiaceae bacterium]|nr:helix-turn-helix domain-containing protein [Polyangiaceae bacterium]